MRQSPVHKNRPLLRRLGFAGSGLVQAFRRERSLRTQGLIGAAVLITVVVLQPGLVWTALVLLAAGLVIALELLNTALEVVIDRLHPEIAPEIKLAKDIAAAAVLTASVTAVAIGILMVISVAAKWLGH